MKRLILAGMIVLSGIGVMAAPAAAVQPVDAKERDAFIEQYAATYRFTLGRPRSITVTPDGEAVLFLRSPARSFVGNLYEFNCATGTERVLLTADKILGGGEEKLTAEELARRERMRMASRGIASYSLSKDGSKILVPLSGRLFIVERLTGKTRELKSEAGYPIDPQLSRDATKLACVRDGEVYVTDLASGRETKVTSGAGGSVTHGLAEFIAQEEMSRFHGFWWSPDGSRICYQRTDTAGLETFHIADPMNPAKEPESWPYPRPGKKNAEVTLALIGATGGDTTWITWDRETYPYLANVVWDENAPLTLLVQNRNQTEQLLLAVDESSGSTTVLLKETDAAWLNIHESCPKWLDDGSAFLWMTESGGAWQAELRGRDGALVRALTEPTLGLFEIRHVNESTHTLTVTASALPTQSHLWNIPMGAGAKPVRLTEAAGQHGAVFGEGDDVYVHTYSTLEGQMGWKVRNAAGKELGSLTSVAETPPFVPVIELTRVGVERTFHAGIVRPRNFDVKKNYPVIASVYTGPGSNTVNASAMGYLLQQWLADHGFIVVLIDGRGTPKRGREWERAWKKDGKGNLIDIALEDQVAGLKALGEKYPEMDLSRVGVTGWSFGGYFAAMAAMRRPDIYKAGVAGAPVCDWLDYDTHYTERYLGLPQENAEGYEKSNVLTYCKDLESALLIIHGTADDNVYFMHSLKMTGELFRHGRRFEFLPLSGFTHMVPDPVVTVRLQKGIAEFFVRNLEP